MAEIVTIPKVYLTDKTLNRHSAHHTIYVGEGDPRDPRETPLQSLTFEFGVARNVPKALFDRLKALGHVMTDRPVVESDV